VNPLALLLAIDHASLLAVPASPDATCPTAVEVRAALSARVPGVLVEPERAVELGALVLRLDTRDRTRPSFHLVDTAGSAHLERTLAIAPGEKDCPAVADTISLIVERFLRELDDRLSGGEGPGIGAWAERRWDLSLGGGWRPDYHAMAAVELLGRAGRLWGPRRRLMLTLAAGIGGSATAISPDSGYPGTATVQRIPLELGLWWRWPLSLGEVQAGAVGALEVTRVRAVAGDGFWKSRTLPGPAAAFAAALRVPLGPRAFFRLSSTLGVAVVKYRFSFEPETGGARVVVFSSPTRRFYGKLAGEIGVAFR
jgi:hypothetical protein